jgi:cytochrome c-type biogenesis protein CcmH/NrfG
MEQNQGSNTGGSWTGTQAYVLAIICLVAGVAIGYLVRGSASPATGTPQVQASSAAPESGAPMGSMGGAQQPSPDQMKHMADKQVEPLLAALKASPNDPQLLYKIGNVYYDTQQYPEAVKYYEDSLKVKPADPDVRTDMATAYFYMGDTDRALTEFDQVLKQNPTHANAMFNEGMVRWQGKMDVNGAVAVWKRLLATNPNYEKRDQVQNLIAKAEQHMTMKPGTKTNKPAQIQ